jgi:hypothetical protein
VTLNTDNLIWLRGRVRSSKLRSLSELLDQLVEAARKAGQAEDMRSVVGRAEIDPSDPLLDSADEAIRSLFNIDTKRAKKRRA